MKNNISTKKLRKQKLKSHIDEMNQEEVAEFNKATKVLLIREKWQKKIEKALLKDLNTSSSNKKHLQRLVDRNLKNNDFNDTLEEEFLHWIEENNKQGSPEGFASHILQAKPSLAKKKQLNGLIVRLEPTLTGNSALFKACEVANYSMAIKLLWKDKSNLEKGPDPMKPTPLFALLDGDKPDKLPKHQYEENRMHITKLLLENGIDAGIENENGETALSYAETDEEFELIEKSNSSKLTKADLQNGRCPKLLSYEKIYENPSKIFEIPQESLKNPHTKKSLKTVIDIAFTEPSKFGFTEDNEAFEEYRKEFYKELNKKLNPESLSTKHETKKNDSNHQQDCK